MSPHEPMPNTPEPSTPGPVAGSGTTPPGRRAGWGLPAVSLAAGLLAGLLAWGIGQTPAVDVEPGGKQVNFMGSESLITEISYEERQEAIRQRAIRAFGVLGGVTGLILGVAGGLAAGSRRRAAIAGGVGLVAGVLLGAGLPMASLTWFEQRRAGDPVDLTPSLMMHAAFWLPIGAVAGLALAMGRGRRALHGIVGGAAGALLATVLYEVVGAMAFPFAETGDPVSATWATRLMGRLLVATFAAAGAAVAIEPPDAEPKQAGASGGAAAPA